MNARSLLSVAAFAAAAFAGAAQADDAYQGQYAVKFEGSRTRAEVMAEAARVPATRSQEPAGSRVAAPLKSDLEVKAVRAQAADAVRLGRISSGEIGL